MTRYEGSNWVKAGYYWNPSRWEIVAISKKGGVLPGGNNYHFVRLPLLLVMVLAPLMGGLYVIFLPFIGFAMILSFAGKEIFSLVRRAIRSLLLKWGIMVKEEG